MIRYITLLDEAGNLELTLPVTPASYSWPHEAVIETVTVDQLGDLNFWGGKKMGSTTLPDCLLPAHAYPFLTPGAGTNPWAYVEQLERWIDAGTVLRLLVSGTPVNAAVLLEGLHYREQDGTNDLYADITLRQYQQPETPVTPAQQTGSTAATRPSATGASPTRSYTVVSGDTMWGICRKFYGDGSLAWRLAAANGVANANLIYPGQTLTIPPKDNLPAAAAKPVSAQIAEATTAVEEKDGSGNTVKITPWVPESTVRNLTQNALETIQTGGSALPWLTTNSSW